MPIITVLLVILMVGLVVWLINTYTPIPPPFKTLIMVLSIVLLLIWILQLTGLLSGTIGPVGPVVPTRLR